jgi:hypothetical protein
MSGTARSYRRRRSRGTCKFRYRKCRSCLAAFRRAGACDFFGPGIPKSGAEVQGGLGSEYLVPLKERGYRPLAAERR